MVCVVTTSVLHVSRTDLWVFEGDSQLASLLQIPLQITALPGREEENFPAFSFSALD